MIKSVLSVRHDFEITNRLLEELDFFYLTQDLYSPVKSVFACSKKDFVSLARVTASDISSEIGVGRKQRILQNLGMMRESILSSMSKTSRMDISQEGLVLSGSELNFGPFLSIQGDVMKRKSD